MVKLPGGVRRWLHLSKGTSDLQQRIDEELDFHLERRTEDLMRDGLPRLMARDQALQEFGDMQEARVELGQIDRAYQERARRVEAWSGLRQDFKVAWRMVSRQPAFTLVIALTLGLGLGVNATAFDLVDRLLYRTPAGIGEPDDVQRIYFQSTSRHAGVTSQPSTMVPTYLAMRKSRLVEDVGAYMATDNTLGRGAESQKIRMTAASASFFDVLRARPALGRFYSEAEDAAPHGSRVVVLSHAFWQSRFGGARDVLSKPLLIGKNTYYVVGVAEKGFYGVDLHRTDVWLPVSVIAREWIGEDWTTSRSMSWLRTVARLAPTATPEQAAAELTSIWRGEGVTRIADDKAAMVLLGPVQEARGPWASEAQKSGRVATWLAGVSLLVLLVACANVANLLLTRAIRRRRDTALRLALGIGRRRLLRQFFFETMLLSALAGAAALVFARWGGGALRTLILPDVEWSSTIADDRLLAFLGVAVLVTAVATMSPPALQMVRQNIIPALKTGPRDGYGRSRIRTSLLFLQAALSVVLLIGAGLFVRSFRNVDQLDLGFDARQVLIADIDLDLVDYNRERKNEFYLAAVERLSKLSGVESVALGTSVPFWSAMQTDVRAEGVDSLPTIRTGGPYIVSVTHDYFRTTGLRVVRGRGFGPDDREGTPRVAIVNETMAKLLWPGEDAIGKCLYVGDPTEEPPCSTVVGVAQDAKKMELSREPVMDYYLPFGQHRGGFLALFIRTKGEPITMLSVVQRELQAGAPDLPYANVRVMQELIEPQTRSWQLGATLFSAFGILALLLAALGLYTMLSHSVASRTAEMGVRMALGASTRDVMRLVVRDGVRVAAAGVGAGVVIALIAGRSMGPMLFEVTPRDPATYVSAATILLAVALLAALLPARRATRVDPAIALRAE